MEGSEPGQGMTTHNDWFFTDFALTAASWSGLVVLQGVRILSGFTL